MIVEDAAWVATAQPIGQPACDACFMIAAEFRTEPGAILLAPPGPILLAPPGLEQRTAGWLGAAEVLGREGALIAYYERLLAVGAGEPGGPSWHPFPYFAVRPAIFADGQMVTEFLWTDDVPDTRAVLQALIEPGPDGMVLDDQDQCWAIRMIRTGGMIAFIEWDAEKPMPMAGGYTVQAAQLAKEAEDALDRLRIVHDRLIAALGQDFWTSYRPAPPEPPAPGRLARLFRAWWQSRSR